MDTLSQRVVGSDMDTEMTALTSEDITEESLCGGDEVELLQNRYTFDSLSGFDTQIPVHIYY